jgi:two-component system, cell cycle sensor histidine kinase and response regulator CckA
MSDPAEAPTTAPTVLVVEDEPAVRRLTSRALQMYGYQVLEAGSGDQAVSIAGSHEGPIDLLVCDVVMPRKSGAQTAEEVRRLRPEVHVLFITGYHPEVIAGQGGLPPGAALLQKPFKPAELATRVEEILST